jgi:hypothetical protein
VAVGAQAANDAVARAYDRQFGGELDGKPLDRALLTGLVELVGAGTIADVGCGRRPVLTIPSEVYLKP